MASVVTIGLTVFVMTGRDTDATGEGIAGQCEYSNLLNDDGDVSQSYPEAVSPSGEYIAGSNSLDDPLWSPDGETINLGKTVTRDIDEIDNASATATNSDGTVVGDSEGKTGQPDRGWMYHDGDVIELTLPDNVDIPDSAEVEVLPVDINEDGEIAGYTTIDTTDDSGYRTDSIPMRWKAGDSEATMLEVDGDGAEVAAITEDGAVIGSEFKDRDGHGDDSADSGQVWTWDHDGKRENLPLSGNVIDVAGDWLLGTDRDDTHYRWNMAEEGDREEVSLNTAIDASGRVIGTQGDRAAMETGSGVEELPVPTDNQPESTYLALGMNDDSRIITGIHVFGPEEAQSSNAVVWHCAD